MNRSCFTLAIATLLLGVSAPATAQECQGLIDLQAQARSGANDGFWKMIGFDSGPTECATLVSVVDTLINGHKAGGLKLEEDRPFNAQAAQADLAKAQADPEVRQRLEKIRKEVANPTRRLVDEAAVLDEEGYYSARDLRINQLKQQLK